VAPDWRPLLEAARLDPARLKPVEPRWTPPFHSDARAAWEGTWPEQPAVALRIEAAAYRGRPVWFQVVHPWTRAERDSPYAHTGGEHTARTIGIALLVGLIATGVVLARRNILTGRGDRRGALRLGLALAALGAASSIIGMHHVADASLELASLARGGGLVVLVALMVWLFYLALEPYVRRLRPWTLVSWTRLLNGGYRDAVVGRDVLIGMVWGACVALLAPLLIRLPPWFGLPAPLPKWGLADTLLGTRTMLQYLIGFPVDATLIGLSLLLLFLVLRFVVRRDLPAAALVVAILTATVVGDSPDTMALMVALGVVLYSSLMLMLLRVGVLAAISALYTADLLAGMPHSLELGSWTGSATVVIVPALLVLAVVAYRGAMGGHLGLRRFVTGEVSSSRRA
jgi:serine/threonine-protein kinase